MQLNAHETTSDYACESHTERMKNDAVIRKALQILEKRIYREGHKFDSPTATKDYLRIKFASVEREVFSVVFLDAQHGVISIEDMFAGTITQTSVYPREIVKRALRLNAAAVVLAHNHPSGNVEPSRADESLTNQIKTVLAMVDVRVIDHIIVGGLQTMSFAERGLI
jgi:DNA repair protein RadC